MKKIISICAVLVYSAMINPANAASDVVQQLKDCARTQDDAQRIACYEALGKSVLAAEPTDQAATQAQTANSQVKDLPDSIGGGKYAQDAGVPKEQFRGVLKSCKKSLDKRWFYIFENGQVWKQVRHKNIRHKNCNVSANLTKDGFGYIMSIDGEDRKVRVRRHR